MNERCLEHTKRLLSSVEGPAAVVVVPAGTGVWFCAAAFAAWEQKQRQAGGWNKLVLQMLGEDVWKDQGAGINGQASKTKGLLPLHLATTQLLCLLPAVLSNQYWPQSVQNQSPHKLWISEMSYRPWVPLSSISMNCPKGTYLTSTQWLLKSWSCIIQ